MGNKSNDISAPGALQANPDVSGNAVQDAEEVFNNPAADPRHLVNGRLMFRSPCYSDQPKTLLADDGALLACITTGVGKEGMKGQHVLTMRSTDQGLTWSEPSIVEPPDGPQASYAAMLKTPSGRIYIFYNYNIDELEAVKTEQGETSRVDTLGAFMYKYSDDHGKTWSENRYRIPVRETEIDRNNPYQGKVQFFWNVSNPFTHDSEAFVSLHKVGSFGKGFMTISEGILLMSPNLLTETDPEKITWETLPEGDQGIRPPEEAGRVGEEHSYVVLSDGTFYCVFRTIHGNPCCSISRDRGRTWSPADYLRYHDGSKIKNPRAANFVWKASNGKYIYWFHNHGGHFVRDMYEERCFGNPYDDRNPAWLCGGTEIDTPDGKDIAWSFPEIALYTDDPLVRMSYPDYIELDGKHWISETEKADARMHEVPDRILNAAWNDPAILDSLDESLIIETADSELIEGSEIRIPESLEFTARDFETRNFHRKDLRQGFALELMLSVDDVKAGDIILDNRNENDKGFCLFVNHDQTLELMLSDAQNHNHWTLQKGILKAGEEYHIVINIDGGPRVISAVVNGKFMDGAEDLQFGWTRFSPHLRDINGSGTLKAAPNFSGKINLLRLYKRYLLTNEACARYNLLKR
mgnify:CR=1 FL=1